MPATLSTGLEEALQRAAVPLDRAKSDYDALLEMVGDSRFVLLGEATHGTHEFYRERAQITKRLIQEKNFSAIAVEADWPDAYRVNRFVRGETDDADAEEALRDFQRFPSWMWRNADVLDFVGWLREHNDRCDRRDLKVGFYGLDLYSLQASISAVLDYLRKVDPEEARRARSRYSCFDDFGADPHQYATAATTSQNESCEEEVIRQLVELRRRAEQYSRRDHGMGEDEYFYAEQNARLVKNAEQYYRAMYHGRSSSWNLRDRHMSEMVDALLKHLEKRRPSQKIIIWAHNSHLGDARATQMGNEGELNVGQLVREKAAGSCVLVGLTTYSGSVTAASEWDGPAERKRVVPATAESCEAVFHETGLHRLFLNLRDDPGVRLAFEEPRLQRAIGVIYSSETERLSHYFEAQLAKQFDAILHFDETRSVEPLERTARWIRGAIPETYPFSV